ncbi:recombinase family protein [Mesorhizobium sp. URHB0026]
MTGQGNEAVSGLYAGQHTEEQGRSGLGLEAQERDFGIYLETFSEVAWEVIGRVQDVLSEGSDDRPQLAEAIKLVRATGAELLVAKLDRLSREVAFIATLMKDKKVRLRVAQMPNADPFQLHLYAAMAEQERKFISERTKAALKAARAQLGGLRDKTHEAQPGDTKEGEGRSGEGYEDHRPLAERRSDPHRHGRNDKRHGGKILTRRQVVRDSGNEGAGPNRNMSGSVPKHETQLASDHR